MQENRFKTFFVWMRNGISFVFTWLMILILFSSRHAGIENISVVQLIEVMLFVIGAVFLFTILFSKCIFYKISFYIRLTSFMILFGIYESISFYRLGLFTEEGSILSWGIFLGIILVSYIVCVGIFQIYSCKKGVLYTQALSHYQELRKQEMNVKEK